MKKTLILSLILFTVQLSLKAQPAASMWDKWEFLIGEWKGEGNGNPGQGSGNFSFRKDLSDKILVRKNHTEFPAEGNRPAYSHDDLMIVYFDHPDNLYQAIYFDNEGHTIRYQVQYSENEIILTSEIIRDAPRFQLKYQKISDGVVDVVFSIASPQHPEEFNKYLEGKSNRIE